MKVVKREEVIIPRALNSFLAFIFDGICALFLGLYALIIGPLGILRGPLVLERFFLYAWVLIPQRALTRTIRAATDWRVGHFSLAIIQLDNIIVQLHKSYSDRATESKKRVLLDLYTVITRAYLHIGNVDKAMQIILHVQKTFGINRLTGLADLDAKTAHLIRAGIAAGKMLEGGGMATMFIKSDKVPQSSEKTPATEKKNTQTKKKSDKEKTGQVIPFPLP